MGRINRNLDETGQVGRAVLDEMGEQTETLGKVGGWGVTTILWRELGGGEWGGVADTEWQRDGEREEWAYQSCVAGAVSAVGAVTRVLLSMSPCLSVSSTFRRLSLHSVVAFAHICVHLSLASPSLCLSVSFASLDLGQSEHNHDRY